MLPVLALAVAIQSGVRPLKGISGYIECLTCQGNATSFYASISADGRYVAFESRASNLVPGDTNGVEDIFVADTANGEIECITLGANGYSEFPTISGNGRYVMFSSTSPFDRGDRNGTTDVFVWDRESGAAPLRLTNIGDPGWISASGRFLAFEQWPQGQGIVLDERDGSSFGLINAPEEIGGIRLSSNGRFIGYRTVDSSDPYNTVYRAYVMNGYSQSVEEIDAGLGGTVGPPKVTDDGRIVVYWEGNYVRLYDRLLGMHEPVGKYPTGEFDITPDGRWLAWTEYPTEGHGTIMLKDRSTGSITVESELGECWDPVLSLDASRIAYIAISPNGIANVYVKWR